MVRSCRSEGHTSLVQASMQSFFCQCRSMVLAAIQLIWTCSLCPQADVVEQICWVLIRVDFKARDLPSEIRIKNLSEVNQSPQYSHLILVIHDEAVDSRVEVKSFDHSKLKHVETEEKNPLPTPQTLKEEMRPEELPDVSEVASFDTGKLKHVETQEKVVLPTSDGMYIL